MSVIPAVRTVRFSVAAAIAFMLAACATLVEEPPIPLPEGRWELLSASFTDIGRIPGVPRATLQIRDGRLSAFGGCNTGAGSAASVDGKMVISALATTRRACVEPLGGFEGRLFKLLREQPYFRTEAGVLTLAAGEFSARFRRLPEPKPAAKPAQP